MKIVLTADVHLGKSGRLDDVLFALRSIRQYMHDNEIAKCFVLGDAFHDRTGTTWEVLARTVYFFEETKRFGQEWITFPGNHDMFLKNSWEFNALKSVSNVMTVYDDVTLIEVGGARFRIVPFVHYESVYMQVVDAALDDKDTDKDDIILTHIGVKNASLNECFLLKHWSVVSFENVPHKVYTGHFHCHQMVGDNLWYPGSPIPFNFAEGVVDHGFLVFDTETRTHEFIRLEDHMPDDRELYPASGKPPLFTTVTSDVLESLTPEDLAGNRIRIAISRNYTRDEMVGIRTAMEEKGAQDVQWMRLKEEEVTLSDDERRTLSVGDPQHLLEVWFDKDQPEGIDREALMTLNKKVIAEGNERISVEE